MGFLGRVGRFIADTTVLLLVITFMPGLPPNVDYPTIE